MSIDEWWNRFAQSFKNRQNTLLRHSTFLVRYSIFVFSEFLFRFDWTLAARGDARMILRKILTANRRISNPPEAEMMKCGIAALSLFSKLIMIEYLTSIFVIPCLQSAGGGFDIRYLLSQSFLFDLTGRSLAGGCA